MESHYQIKKTVKPRVLDDSFGEILERFRIKLHRYGLSKKLDTQLVEDVVQETMIKAVKHEKLLEMLKPKQVNSWMYSVFNTTLIDYYKNKIFRHEDYSSIEFLPDHQNIQNRDFKIDVEKKLNDLDDIKKNILILKFWNKCSDEEIAEKMGVSPSTIRYHIAAAKKILKQKFEE